VNDRTNEPRQDKATTMAQTIAEHLMEQGEARGELRSLRRVLRHWLEQEHGNLTKIVLDRITACDDIQRLEQVLVNALLTRAKPEDLEL
jgi:hypothetical protein